MEAADQSPTALAVGKSFWTPGRITWCVLGGVLIVAGAVIVGVLLVRAHNHNKQLALKAEAETAKQIAAAKEKALDAPPDSSDAPPNDDPVVTQSVLDKAQKSQWKKTVDYVCRKFRSCRDFVVKCLNETPQVRAPGKRGRVQNDVRKILFERAVLYQLSHNGCSPHNACRRSFLQVKGGYGSVRSLYEFWREHPLEADQAKASLSEQIAASGLSPQKFCEKFDRDNTRILQGNSV